MAVSWGQWIYLAILVSSSTNAGCDGCTALTAPTDGYITYAPDTVAPFNSGTEEPPITVTMVTVWQHHPPQGVPATCPAVTLFNGEVTYSTAGPEPYPEGTVATYTCDEGYELTGEATGTCVNLGLDGFGIWTPFLEIRICEGEMVICPTLSPPANGQVAYSSTGLLTSGVVATFSCVSGFRLMGAATRTCGGDGAWSGEDPVCEVVTCSSLGSFTNGVITYSPDRSSPYDLGTAATYSCFEGFYLVGTNVKYCEDGGGNGVWTGSTPICAEVMCLTLMNPANGYIIYSEQSSSTVGYSETATYYCNTGYVLSGGSSVRTCSGSSSSGEWTGSAPSCILRTCSSLGTLSNGQISYSPDTTSPHNYGTTATFICNSGYGRSGAATRTCGVNGWSGSSPTCQPYMCASPLPSIPNGVITYSPDSTSPFNLGTTATYSCSAGFYLAGRTERTCIATGYWDGTQPACLEITCVSLNPPSNEVVTYGPDTTPPYDYQTTASYSCSSGYGLSGGDTSRQCVSYSLSGDGWSGTAPTCPIISCPPLSNPANGRVTFSSNSYTFGAVATYTCNGGYGLNGGAATRTCGGDGSSSNGEWNGTSPICQPITCSDLPGLTDGIITYSASSSSPHAFGTTATYSCGTGYRLSGGDTTRNCSGGSSNSNGFWLGTAPTCDVITCPSLSAIPNGDIAYSTSGTSSFSYNTVATYTCNMGFFLEGVVSQTCGVDESGLNAAWSGTAPVCAAIMCPELSDPENGQIMYSEVPDPTVGFMEMATYSCNVGFGLSGGDEVRTCVGPAGSSGEWKGSAPTCQAITCLTLGTLSNGLISYSTDTTSPHNFGTVATFTCNTGFGLMGEMSSTCEGDGSSRNGTWSISSPICVEYTCPSLDSIPNGAITYSLDMTSLFDYGTTATYSCNEGFHLSGSPDRTCSGAGITGFWDGTQPECIAIVCASLAFPLNGIITYDPDTMPPHDYQTTASYSCTTGFGLSGGDRSRECVSFSLSDSGWSGNAPNCEIITCPTLSAPTNGQVVYSTPPPYTFISGAVATYSCDEGYGLSGGNSTTICGGDSSSSIGVWSGVVPVCEAIICLDLTVPANGMITYSPTLSAPHSFEARARYSCDDGFALIGGDTSRTCEGDGSSLNGIWSGVGPICQVITCSPLSSVANGNIVYDPDTTSPFNFGTTATYSCDEGFFLEGNEVQICGGEGRVDGVWSGSIPVCAAVECPVLTMPANGYITYDEVPDPTLGFMEMATYGCNAGFGLSGGDRVRTCLGTGSSDGWTGNTPSCEVITCPSLGTLTNGQVSYSADTTSPHNYGTTATFSCDVGFGLSGVETRTCEGNGLSPAGVWSESSPPICIAYTCDPLLSILNGVITYSSDQTSPFDYGTTATYSCNEGFYLSGRAERTCTGAGITGFWNNTQPVCLVIECRSLPHPNNGVVTYGPDTISPFDYQTIAIYSCNDGYGLSGGDRSRECVNYSVNGGEWSGTAPTCPIITCPTLSPLANGQVSYSAAARYTVGAVITYSCDEGYGLNGGNMSRTCGGDGSSSNGEWDGTTPTCEAIICLNLTVPSNGVINYSSTPHAYEATATYSCVDGFGLVGGDITRTCGEDSSSVTGVWSGGAPRCQAITCSSLSSVPNGVISYSSDGASSFSYSTTATYTCDEGYFFEGDRVRACGGDGTGVVGVWGGSDPVCAAIMCPVLPALENGFITYSEEPSPTLGFMEIATYSCNVGFGLSGGDGVRRCVGPAGSSGEWNGTVPTCQPITCPSLESPANGQVRFSTDISPPYNFETVATFTCNTGYGLDGDTTRTCGGDGSSIDGVWSGSSPVCIAYICTSLSSISDGMITYDPDQTSPFDYGTAATYSCNEGFYLSGRPNRTCTGSGITGFWDSSEPECLAIVCTSLSSPANGIISYSPDSGSPYEYQTAASYSCNDGYGLSGGDSSRECVDYSVSGGEWSGTAPTCEVITCPPLSAPVNGQVSYSMVSPFTSGTVASYSCDEGYVLSPTIIMRTCGGDGSSATGVWSGGDPICEVITCPDLTDPTDGEIIFSPMMSPPYEFGTTATYSCYSGYGLNRGDMTRTCERFDSTTNGVWSGEPSSCGAITCSSLSPVNNGVITYSPDTTEPFDSSTTATYSCDEGFYLEGSESKMCSGDGSSVNGTWSGTTSVCLAIMCPVLPASENGVITYSEEPSPTLGFLETATYSCNVGFGLSGGDRVRTCAGAAGSSGGWNGTTPACQPITCPSLESPANGQVSFSMDDISLSYNYETVAMFTCNIGFGLDGEETRTCGGDGLSINGVWSESSPTCVPYYCALLPSIDNGTITYDPDQSSPFDYGTTATYSCNEGFYMSERPDRTCTGSGITGFWNGTQSECLAIVCTSLSSPANGIISYSSDSGSSYEYQTAASYSCNDGYGLSGGDSSRECVNYSVSGGEWSGTAPTCEVITCPPLSAPVNGQVFYSMVSPFTSGTVATYSCDEGYVLNPVMIDSERICEGDSSSATGVWSGMDPICEVITCPDLTVPTNGVITFSPNMSTPYEFGTTATYSCYSGYGLNRGDMTRICERFDSTTNGVWSGEPSSCGAITCSSLSPVNNGVITYSPDTTEPFNSSTTATHSCDEGFYLEGSENRTCSGDGSSVNGVWSGTTSVCLAPLTNLLYKLDDVNCDTVNVTWETILAEELAGTFSFHVVITQRSTGETISATTTDHFVTLTSLSCCEEYDFTVSTGINGVYGDPVMHREGFKTLSDLSEPVIVSVAVESEISLIVSWVEPPSIVSQHSPTDTYIVTVTPDCQYYQPQDLTVPGPQTASYSKSSVGVTGLDPNVAYKLRVNTTVCDSSLLVYERTWRTISGKDDGAPVLSVSRKAGDPSLASIEWLTSSEIAVNISLFAGDVYNPSNLVKHEAVNSTTTSLQGLDVCNPYWVVVSFETCVAEAVNSPVKLDLVDAYSFEFAFNLEKEENCEEFIQTESADAIINLENALKESLQSAKCSQQTRAITSTDESGVTCFGGSTLSCPPEKDYVLFSTKLVGQGPGKSSAVQNLCLTEWLKETPSVVVSISHTQVVLYAVPVVSDYPIPVYGIVLIAIAILLLIVVLILAALLYQRYRRRTKVKVYRTAESARDNPTYNSLFYNHNVNNAEPSLTKAAYDNPLYAEVVTGGSMDEKPLSAKALTDSIYDTPRNSSFTGNSPAHTVNAIGGDMFENPTYAEIDVTDKKPSLPKSSAEEVGKETKSSYTKDESRPADDVTFTNF